jgi:transcriptional regulator with XRE-family HTH domain
MIVADTGVEGTTMATVDYRRDCRDDFDDEDSYGDPFAVADSEHSDVARAEADCVDGMLQQADEALRRGQTRSPRYHRIADVRRRQGVTLRNVARRLGMALTMIRRQEQPDYDLRLSDLQRWQQVLDVPVAELLVEGEGQLSGPVLERSRMVKLMKTAAAIRERTSGTPVGRLVGMMIGQILEIMPELKDVTPWNTVGQRRTLDELGRTGQHVVPEDLFRRRV